MRFPSNTPLPFYCIGAESCFSRVCQKQNIYGQERFPWMIFSSEFWAAALWPVAAQWHATRTHPKQSTSDENSIINIPLGRQLRATWPLLRRERIFSEIRLWLWSRWKSHKFSTNRNNFRFAICLLQKYAQRQALRHFGAQVLHKK